MRTWLICSAASILWMVTCAELSGQRVSLQKASQDEFPKAQKESGPRKGTLERGFSTNSEEVLVGFLDTWYQEVKPVAMETLKKKPPLEQDVYSIYAALFRPDNKVYRNTKYLIVQGKIDVVILDSTLKAEFQMKPEDTDPHRRPWYSRTDDLPAISRLVIKEFRPPVKVQGKKILYLCEDYLGRLVAFLTQEKYPDRLLRGDQYLMEKCETKARKERLAYLNKALMIFPGHWGSGWVLESYPTVSGIYFSSDLKRAVVQYRAPVYRGGSALLEKDADGAWKIVLMRTTWME